MSALTHDFAFNLGHVAGFTAGNPNACPFIAGDDSATAWHAGHMFAIDHMAATPAPAIVSVEVTGPNSIALTVRYDCGRVAILPYAVAYNRGVQS